MPAPQPTPPWTAPAVIALTAVAGAAFAMTSWMLAGLVVGSALAVVLFHRARAAPSNAAPRPAPDPAPIAAPIAARAPAQDAADDLRAVLDTLDGAVIVTNGAGVVVLANRAAAEFFATRPDPLPGGHVEDLFTQAEVLGQHGAALRGQSGQTKFRLLRGGVYRTIEVRCSPVRLATAGPGAVILLRDVTELAKASQLKTDFVANASHELRTPLSSIRAAVETIQDGARDDPAMLDKLTTMIAANVVRLEEMVRDLLDLSRLETPEAPVNLQPVGARAIAESLRDTFETVCKERRLTLEFVLAPELERMHTDPKLLTLILKNLIDNAAKFAYEGTSIRIEGFVPMSEPGEPQRESRRLAARFRVIDQGVGIPLHLQPRIFERFFQVDPARTGGGRRGTGLGLAIVKHAVKALGGAISVDSVWKVGTTMTVDLPQCVELPIAAAARGAANT